jgi:hypothetical protein
MTTKKAATTQKKRKSPRHIFRFKIADDDTKCIESKAIVRQAKKAVQLVLKAEDVRRSMELGGVGNTMTCSMAVCAKRQEDAFPHPVEGYIDWQYRTAYVVTKLNPDTHLPSECVVCRCRGEAQVCNGKAWRLLTTLRGAYRRSHN